MTELRTRTDIEQFAHYMRSSLYNIQKELPENLLFLVIVNKDDFNSLHMEITNQEAQTDRLIYMSSAGIEFGIKISVK